MQNKSIPDPFGEAVVNYYKLKDSSPIIVKSDEFDDDEIETSYLFREYDKMPKLEKLALKHCEGKILDVGACAGPHSLILQQSNQKVTALEKSALCCEIMEKRGIINVVQKDFFDFNNETFDTILFLMNGSGIAGTLNGLYKLLTHAKSLLNQGGQILLDSSDLIYLFENEDGYFDVNLNQQKYYGEIRFWLQYKNKTGNAFNWLYVDQANLIDIAEKIGFDCTVLEYGSHYDYLAKLKLNTSK